MELFLLSLFLWVSGVQSSEISNYQTVPDCKMYETCNCDAGYHNPPLCEKCPGEGMPCAGCCFPENLKCVGHNGENMCMSGVHSNVSFMTAAQVALGAALTIAFVALIALFWKTCPRGNPRGHLSSLLRERESSLTSMQRFILQRLRDRPPRYDDNHQICLEKPPSYDEAASANQQESNSWPSQPPYYYSDTSNTQTLNSIKEEQPNNVLSSNDSGSSTSGAVNPVFTIVDEETTHKKLKVSESHQCASVCTTSDVSEANSSTQSDKDNSTVLLTCERSLETELHI